MSGFYIHISSFRIVSFSLPPQDKTTLLSITVAGKGGINCYYLFIFITWSVLNVGAYPELDVV